MLSLETYPTKESQSERYKLLGYENTEIEDMNTIYYEVIDTNEINRISRLEIFDEFEEYHMMQSHYFFLVSKKALGSYKDVIFYKKHESTKPNLKSLM